MQNRAGANMQPCLTVEVVFWCSILLLLIEIRCSRISGICPWSIVPSINRVNDGVEGGLDIKKGNFQEVTVFSMQFGG